MKYMGSKNRIAKDILPIILKDRKEGQWYVEPFVGGGNLIDKVGGKRIGYDINKYIIGAMDALSKGWTPPDYLNEDDYNHIKNNMDVHTEEFLGFVGFACSYGGKWFGGWCRGNKKDGTPRDYVLEAFNNAEKQKPKIKDVTFAVSSYNDAFIPENSLIYCDPPYQNTTSYKDKFKHNEFWQWCRDKSEQGHTVFVSEYNAPDDFKCVWSKEINSSLTKQTGSKKGTEKLFIYKGAKNV